MALNTNNIGRTIAVVKDNKKYKNVVFSVSEDNEEDEVMKPFYELSIKDGYFQYVPDKHRERDTLFIVGPAGSGKSFYTAQYIKEYKKTFKDNPVYFFSEGKEDPCIDEIKGVKRVEIDDSFITDPIPWTDFENCLVIFDDIDAINGKLGKAVYSLRDKLLKNGRKNRVSVVSTNHNCSGMELKSVLNESNCIVFFMANYNRSLKYLLTEYVGLNKDGIKALKKIKSRSCCFVKSYPNVIITEKKIMTIDKIQDF
jgi:hypothetical protein